MASKSTPLKGRELYEFEYDQALKSQKRRLNKNPRRQSLKQFIIHEEGFMGKPWGKMTLKQKTAIARMYQVLDSRSNKPYQYGPDKGLTPYEGALKLWLQASGRIDQMSNQEFHSYVAASQQRAA